MTEETLFAAALEKATPEERSAFLDDACSGDAALRRRVEALLQSHEHADFLKAPAVKRPAEELVGAATTGREPDPTDGDDAKASLGFLSPSAKPDSLGRLGHYEILEVIGRGGMGVVLRAFDENLHRIVAIKVLAGSLPTNGATRKRFTREARAAAAIRNDHVTAIYAVEEAAEVPYLVMEYIDGVSLQERLDRDGPLEVKEILRIGLQTATGLVAAHAQGLVHRDIKPANILLENRVERVKITDFGLARATADASLTQEGVVAGTPQFMAPEQARGEALDQRADLFSLGSVLYALCTGRPPFRAENTLAVLKRVCEETPRPIREINPDVPPWLVEIIAKLQAKDPAERFQSAQEVAELLGRELATVQRGSTERPAALPRSPGEERGQGPPAKRSRRRLAVAAALALLFTAGFVWTESIGITHFAATLFRGFRPDEPPLAKVDEGKGNNDVIPTKTPAPPQSDPLKPFVVLANPSRSELSFAALAEAVAGAGSGDTIEIRGDGPFNSPGIPPIRGRSLTIRAGAGARPILRSNPEKTGDWRTFLTTDSALILEGLDFQAANLAHPANLPRTPQLLIGQPPQGFLRVANCRFQNPGGWAIEDYGHACVVLNSEFSFNDFVLANNSKDESRPQTLENCVITGRTALLMTYNQPGQQTQVRLLHNTFVLQGGVVDFGNIGGGTTFVPGEQPVWIEAVGNIFDSPVVLSIGGKNALLDKGTISSDAGAEGYLRRVLKWTDRRNVYANLTHCYFMNVPGAPDTFPRTKMPLEGWNRFWRTATTDSRQGTMHYQGGDLLSRSKDQQDQITPADFRLRASSAGKGAGEGGRDLGADVDLIGPGPAYERWKKTPAYQQWLKDSGQKK